ADKQDEFKAMAAEADTPEAKSNLIRYYGLTSIRPAAAKSLAAKTGLPADYLMQMPPEKFDSLMMNVAEHSSDYSVGRAINTPGGVVIPMVNKRNPRDYKLLPLGVSEVSPASRPEFSPVTEASGEIGAFNRRTGGVTGTG